MQDSKHHETKSITIKASQLPGSAYLTPYLPTVASSVVTFALFNRCSQLGKLSLDASWESGWLLTAFACTGQDIEQAVFSGVL